MLPFEVLIHPRRSLDGVASEPRVGVAGAVVVVSGAVSVGLAELAAEIAPRQVSVPSPVLFATLPALMLAFWALSAWLIDAGAGLMALPHRRREMLAAAGHCFVVLALTGLVTVLQAAALRVGAGAGGSWTVGWLNAPALAWFVALLVVAVVSVYRLEAPSALALALLPFGALLAALLVLAAVAAALVGAHAG